MASTEMDNVNGIIRDHVTTWMTCCMAWERSLSLLRRLTQKTRDNDYYSFFLGGGGLDFPLLGWNRGVVEVLGLCALRRPQIFTQSSSTQRWVALVPTRPDT